MTEVAELASGKGHKDENFPVASVIIAKEHRPAVMAFYNFVRLADDVSDNEIAPPEEKLRLLDALRASLEGENDAVRQGVVLRELQKARGLSPVHALDLLEAFRRDCTKLRYTDWDDLIDYCRYSAMPVGRYVLDVHGESKDAWPLNDALCAALQVINHLQDCGKDYKSLNRVYLPQDVLEKHGARVEDLAGTQCTPALKAVIAELAAKNGELLKTSAAFAAHIRSKRLALEVALIQRFAEDLNTWLLTRDPLCERVHHKKSELPALALSAFARFLAGRFKGDRA
ncbi:squalene synthase HpnC [Rhizomicrobium palustre]|uniref:Squalene synthase HpnC n=1 Tax=Rhizomicrobium palustre TaxID=189966 RepID=A0A846N0V2_9PROT|nr:squalene synthase HpnC [Rhizomicrobium palustre]NIK88797.1 squalene synthase HpnC [Rhizomicrobium palustre]